MNHNLKPELKQFVSLKSYNTFGMEVIARYFTKLESENQIPALLKMIHETKLPVLFLGGGSNLLFTKDFDGLAVKVSLQGREVVHQDDDWVYVRVMAGENWHQFVEYCVDNNWGGLENLSLIPGNAGSSPIQNIGAYGCEIKDSFHMLEAIALRTGEFREFFTGDCEFGYRSSVFKHTLKGQYLILSVTFRLSKKPAINTSYGAVNEMLAKLDRPAGIRDVADAICQIRRSKLPDPAVLGNAGSFFKNPVINRKKFRQLEASYPAIPAYQESDSVKLAAGWLIEQCGWKGFRRGDAGVHERQALVLINYGSATGREIADLALEIIESVEHRFGIRLEPEVNIL